METLRTEVEAILDEHYPNGLPPSRTADVAYLDNTLVVSTLESPAIKFAKVVKMAARDETSFTPIV